MDAVYRGGQRRDKRRDRAADDRRHRYDDVAKVADETRTHRVRHRHRSDRHCAEGNAENDRTMPRRSRAQPREAAAEDECHPEQRQPVGQYRDACRQKSGHLSRAPWRRQADAIVEVLTRREVSTRRQPTVDTVNFVLRALGERAVRVGSKRAPCLANENPSSRGRPYRCPLLVQSRHRIQLTARMPPIST